MRRIAQAFFCLTLWCDLNLMLGILFTGQYGNAKISAVMTIGGFSVDSNSYGGAPFITFISIWTAALAICCLLALHAPVAKHALTEHE
jgi:hypothetical protein